MLKLGRRRREGRLIDGDDDAGKDSTHFSASEDNFTVEEEEEEEEVGTEQELGELQLVEQPGREKIGVETKELCDGNSNLEWKGNNSCERGSRKRWRAMEWRSSQSDYISGYAESMEDTGEIRELGTELNGDQLNITESKEGGARGIDWKKNDAKIPLFNKRNLRRCSPFHKRNRQKALRVLGVSENDVEVSLRFFIPRRRLYGYHFPGTRSTVIMQTLKVLFPAGLVRDLIMEYDCPPDVKRSYVSGKALKLLGTKPCALSRQKALRILGETNHQVEETNARYLGKLGGCVSCVSRSEGWPDICGFIGIHLSEICGSSSTSFRRGGAWQEDSRRRGRRSIF